MNTSLRIVLFTSLLSMISGCSMTAAMHSTPASSDARDVHQKFLAAINSDNTDAITAMMCDTVVFLPPNEPVIEGKPAARKWVDDFLKAYTVNEDQTAVESLVAGDWMMLRYTYRMKIRPRAGASGAGKEQGAPPTIEVGKGLMMFHHDSDGTWRVARDAWNSDAAPVSGAAGK